MKVKNKKLNNICYVESIYGVYIVPEIRRWVTEWKSQQAYISIPLEPSPPSATWDIPPYHPFSIVAPLTSAAGNIVVGDVDWLVAADPISFNLIFCSISY